MARELRRHRSRVHRSKRNPLSACNWTDPSFRSPLPSLAGFDGCPAPGRKAVAAHRRDDPQRLFVPATTPLLSLEHASAADIPDRAFYVNLPCRQHFRATCACPRPFMRAWAKLIDLNLYVLAIVLLLGCCSAVAPMLAPDAVAAVTATADDVVFVAASRVFSFSPWLRSLLYMMAMLFAVLMVDALILHKTGTSPGKWLMRIHICAPSNRKLSLAIKRNLWCFSHGLCCGIIPLSLLPIYRQLTRVAQGQSAYWDRKTGYRVHYGEPTIWNYLAIVVFLLLLFALLLYRR